ncbi:hypothetical protein ARMSODRAFT_1091022 [Armillaria solidipes]|uniref:Uncharacterized protein n=1 Tax=Armillaria solidipes TaxID=1076256 RepID=A0A2H3AVL5_9AGAR|nr:hypothetical protein ARMSODRAFT_1091022 [Armillaria solidipes]
MAQIREDLWPMLQGDRQHHEQEACCTMTAAARQYHLDAHRLMLRPDRCSQARMVAQRLLESSLFISPRPVPTQNSETRNNLSNRLLCLSLFVFLYHLLSLRLMTRSSHSQHSDCTAVEILALFRRYSPHPILTSMIPAPNELEGEIFKASINIHGLWA